jgi:inner membrane protein YidH
VLHPKEAARERPASGQPTYDVRHYLAEERTFLAWIRTILGLMGFGFVLARIDRASLWLGTALIAVGAVLSVLAVQRHRRMVEELNHPRVADGHPSRQGVFLALFLAVAGVAMVLHLVLS